ncbi:nuclear transport factor 2 family protein [Alkalihalobacillus sp. BA299]|uniref:nuclear transport factor 2 family protein n=1 Tax=Alkalihalobacillus sp. BA299 TaxID=2815938 RepID=UPI001ADA6A7F|nr:nuclear transport factor 2 family protein [Alkalihalobacillus sp. BA299]
MAKSLDERILELEAREQIKELMANYNRGIDTLDEELFISIWEENAVWDTNDPLNISKNKLEILERVKLSWRDFPETHHFTTNEVIHVDLKNGVATAVADVDCTLTNSAGVALVSAASYTDKFSNRSGKWLFSERKIKIHYNTPVLEPWSNTPESRFNLKLEK